MHPQLQAASSATRTAAASVSSARMHAQSVGTAGLDGMIRVSPGAVVYPAGVVVQWQRSTVYATKPDRVGGLAANDVSFHTDGVGLQR